MDTFALVAQERTSLVAALTGVTAEQWTEPSRCDGWSERDVLAHLVFPLETSLPSLLLRMLRARFDFNRMADEAARGDSRAPAELLAAYRANVGHRFTPPGFGAEAPLTDTVVHGDDMLVPLGVRREVAPEALTTVLAFLVSTKATLGFTARGRVVGLRFAATDVDWSSGTGPEVTGRGADLASAICGRPSALGDLAGDGLDTLRARL
jgi:uncharacterized protein (TIGR03083 family)